MRNILLITYFFISSHFWAQENLDKEIDVGIEFYKNGEKAKALKTWKLIEAKAENPSSTLGTTLGNILYYYIEQDDEKNVLNYYKKITTNRLKYLQAKGLTF